MCLRQYVGNRKRCAIKIAHLLDFPIVEAIKPSGPPLGSRARGSHPCTVCHCQLCGGPAKAAPRKCSREPAGPLNRACRTDIKVMGRFSFQCPSNSRASTRSEAFPPAFRAGAAPWRRRSPEKPTRRRRPRPWPTTVSRKSRSRRRWYWERMTGSRPSAGFSVRKAPRSNTGELTDFQEVVSGVRRK